MMTDTIADMLTRVRNAITIKRTTVEIPLSNKVRRIARIMKDEGYIGDYEEIKEGPQGTLRVHLRYIGEEMESPIHGMKRVSRSGRRVYRGYDEIPDVLGGLGIAIVSTNKGIITGREAARQKVGGEILCSIW